MNTRAYALAEFRRLRRELKVTQSVLAARCWLSQSYVAELESGKRIGSPALWGELLFHLDDRQEWEQIGAEAAFERERDKLAGTLSRSEPSLIESFLRRIAKELKMHFYVQLIASFQNVRYRWRPCPSRLL